jgi:MFS family permease
MSHDGFDIMIEREPEAPAVMTPRQRYQSLAAVIASAFAASLTFSICMPLLALILERRGTDTTMIGLNTASASLGLLIFTVVAPRAVSRLGTMRALYLGFILMIFSIVLLPVFDNVWAWFPLRFLMGIGIAIHWVTSETWINTIVEDRIRGRVMGIYVTALSAGYLAGLPVLYLVGSEGYLPFFIVSATMSIAVFPLVFARNLAPGIKTTEGFGILAAMRRAPATMSAALTDGFVLGALFAFFLIYVQRLGFDEQDAIVLLIVMSLGNVVLQYPIGLLADRFDRRLLLILFALLVAAGTAGLPFFLMDPIWRWILLFLWGGIMGGIYTCGLALVGQRFQKDELAGANATFIFTYEVGTLAGPVVGGFAMSLWDPNGLLVVTVGAGVLFALLATVRHIRMRGVDSG